MHIRSEFVWPLTMNRKPVSGREHDVNNTCYRKWSCEISDVIAPMAVVNTPTRDWLVDICAVCESISCLGKLTFLRDYTLLYLAFCCCVPSCTCDVIRESVRTSFCWFDSSSAGLVLFHRTASLSQVNVKTWCVVSVSLNNFTVKGSRSILSFKHWFVGVFTCNWLYSICLSVQM